MANMAVTKKMLKFSIETQNPISVWGDAGIGKTEAIRQVSKELGYNCVELHLATQDLADLIGIPTKDEFGKTTYAKPSWFVDELTPKKEADEKGRGGVDPSKPTVYFLDEMNRGNRMVLATMLPFLLDGKIHEHRIGPKDAIVAACNFANEDYEVSEIVDKALIDRCGHIVLNPEVDEWKAHLGSKIDMTTLGLISTDTKMFEIKNVSINEGCGFDITPSRRKVENIMSHFTECTDSWVQSVGGHVLRAWMGPEFASLWVKSFREDANKLVPQDIYRMSKETVMKINSFTNNENVRVDIIDSANETLIADIRGRDCKLPDKHLKNFVDYIFMLPGDIMRTYVEKILSELPTINGSEMWEFIFNKAEADNNIDLIKMIVESYDV